MNIKNEFIKSLEELQHNFSYYNITDYQCLAVIMYQMLIKQECDEDILNILLEIIKNIPENNNYRDNEIFENYINYSENFQKIFSYRLFSPLNPEYEYSYLKEKNNRN